jgi:hypothetical protein
MASRDPGSPGAYHCCDPERRLAGAWLRRPRPPGDHRGPVAQLVERLLGRQEVRGSTPLRSTDVIGVPKPFPQVTCLPTVPVAPAQERGIEPVRSVRGNLQTAWRAVWSGDPRQWPIARQALCQASSPAPGARPSRRLGLRLWSGEASTTTPRSARWESRVLDRAGPGPTSPELPSPSGSAVPTRCAPMRPRWIPAAPGGRRTRDGDGDPAGGR